MKLPEYREVYPLWNYKNKVEFIHYETTKIQRSLFFLELPEYREVYSLWNYQNTEKFLYSFQC